MNKTENYNNCHNCREYDNSENINSIEKENPQTGSGGYRFEPERRSAASMINAAHDSCGIGAVVNIDGRADRRTVDDALKIVEKLEHRAGRDADGKTGDGVGIMTQIPHSFFRRELKDAPLSLTRGDYAVGMFFLPSDTDTRKKERRLFETIAEKEGLPVAMWRKVPINPDILGNKAVACMPYIAQCFIARPEKYKAGVEFDRRLYVLRRLFEQSTKGSYVVSLSSRTIVYKGMFLVGQLRRFYRDLESPYFESAMALVHSRFSTNTTPSWERAHPNRFILHNGEINTIRGNVDRMAAREETLSSPYLEDDMEKILPVIGIKGSDSAMLDNTVEFLYMNGMELPLALMITMPEPWKHREYISREKKDFYHYYATMMEPWDGPAAVIFSDGDVVGATLDRNGLRPCRWYLTDDGRVIISSEVGVLDIENKHIIKKSRLEPGKMILCDMKNNEFLDDAECKEKYINRSPFGEWLSRYLTRLRELPIPNKKPEDSGSREERRKLYHAFGYTYEDVREVILPMAKNAGEKISSMGIDIPPAFLSKTHQPLFYYFKQLFAQVTNPPIDSLREKAVTDTTVYVGSDGNLLCEKGENCRVLEIENPILTEVDLIKICALDKPGLHTKKVSLLYYKNTSLEKAMEDLFIRCDKAFRNGANIIILSDRGVDENHLAIPSLLAVSGVEQHLIRTKKRTAVSIILESGEPRDVHQFAALLGYGARAVNPYLAHECIAELIKDGILDKDLHTAIEDYNKAAIDGIVKVASKMGISTIQSYQSAQIFEAVGISKEVIDRYFTNTPFAAPGVGLTEIGEDVEWRHNKAFYSADAACSVLPSVGYHKLRRGEEKEEHLYSPETITALREAAQNGDYARFKEYSAMLTRDGARFGIRSLLDFNTEGCTPVPIEEVESAAEIVKRFKTGAMSYGSISKEAHECLALAMNTLGGKSNSGEGGESPERLGTKKNSAIKQVASGRFGVTSEYLVSAREIQIKMAQGAKPGEGGHLPGRKVYPWIARTRLSTPGVALISPPPHHDIYSIEDLAELIYDLKNANPAADISVKLVSEAGVGTIACGVAKSGASVVLISGYEGGTGAAPTSSIHNAGLPLEVGLSEAHRALSENGLREKVRIEADGKLMCGRDVAIAALMGAEEFGFATAPLVTLGCTMMRVCNLDTCPMGIATQDERLRARFCGKPEYVMNFMLFIAEELREIMASLGIRRVDDMVGRRDLIKVKESESLSSLPHGKINADLSEIIGKPDSKPARFSKDASYDFELEKTADVRILIPEFEPYVKSGKPHSVDCAVTSTDRAFATHFGSVITKKFKNTLKDDTYVVNCRGGAGQSFGAFIPKGLSVNLEGDANDYFGKGLSGGKLSLRAPRDSRFKPSENVIVGNAVLYGATSGEAYISGIAGERFCVRNSGAVAVVEGVGENALEYMTGGKVLILGDVGNNFAAGMSGGTAYVYDERHTLYKKINKSGLDMLEVSEKEDADAIESMLRRHIEATDSALAKSILSDFGSKLAFFKKILPHDYGVITGLIRQNMSMGMNRYDAELAAFDTMRKGGV